MSESTVRPPFDPGIERALERGTVTITPDGIAAARALETPDAELAAALECADPAGDLDHRTVSIPGFGGDPITVAILARRDHRGAGPGILHSHGGGMVLGHRYSGIGEIAAWVREFDAVAVSVEYRLAPEFPDPVPVEDCFAALAWVAAHAEELGIDAARLIVAGASAGGGLAAGTALLVRDRGGPALAGQMLIYPMLDSRNSSGSARQFDGIGIWDRESNETGWNALLGDRRDGDVSPYASPARALDLSRLPPAFIDVASAEVFRDEDIAYASKIWADGGVAELHVWPGGTHGFEVLAPELAISQQALAARVRWLRRLFEVTA